MSALKENGITFGKTANTFAPTENLTRGEFALFIYRAEQLTVENRPLPPKESTYAKRVKEIQNQWRKIRPIYDGPILESTPSTIAPYKLGKVRQEELIDALNVTNFVRFLSYLPGNIQMNEGFNEEAQAASVLNAAHQRISHHPEKPIDMEEGVYELGYSGANTSNVGVGYANIKSSILNGYMRR